MKKSLSVVGGTVGSRRRGAEDSAASGGDAPSRLDRLPHFLVAIIVTAVLFMILTHRASSSKENTLNSKLNGLSPNMPTDRLISRANVIMEELTATNKTSPALRDSLEGALLQIHSTLQSRQSNIIQGGVEDDKYFVYRLEHPSIGYYSVRVLNKGGEVFESKKAQCVRIITVVTGICRLAVDVKGGPSVEIVREGTQVVIGRSVDFTISSQEEGQGVRDSSENCIFSISALQSDTTRVSGVKEKVMVFNDVANALRSIENRVPKAISHQHSPASPATLVPTSVPGSTSAKWLVIGIPTVARLNNEGYLLRTLSEIAKQLPREPSSPFYKRVLVVVVNAMPAGIRHPRFEEAQKIYRESDTLRDYFSFSTIADEPELFVEDPRPGATDRGSANFPGHRVR
jgi:hypothetical protein